MTTNEINNDWRTLTVTAVRGHSALYRLDTARVGCFVRPSPALLLQEHSGGHRRTVFGVAVGAALVPADQFDGFISIIRTDWWRTWNALGRVDFLLDQETAR